MDRIGILLRLGALAADAEKRGDAAAAGTLREAVEALVEAHGLAEKMEQHLAKDRSRKAPRKSRNSARSTEIPEFHGNPGNPGNGDTKILVQKQKLKSNSKSKESSPVADAREVPGELPLPGVSWVQRLTGVWTSLAGAVQAGQVGKQLKPLVASRGVDAVEAGMRVYIAKRQGDGAPLNFGWFASDAVQWIDRAADLAPQNGEVGHGALELASRPNGVR